MSSKDRNLIVAGGSAVLILLAYLVYSLNQHLNRLDNAAILRSKEEIKSDVQKSIDDAKDKSDQELMDKATHALSMPYPHSDGRTYSDYDEKGHKIAPPP